MYTYTALEIGIDFLQMLDEYYLPEDYLPEDDEYEHNHKNDDLYELPF
jgi:hypothetical protein